MTTTFPTKVAPFSEHAFFAQLSQKCFQQSFDIGLKILSKQATEVAEDTERLKGINCGGSRKKNTQKNSKTK